jgi:hypothetical protein
MTKIASLSQQNDKRLARKTYKLGLKKGGGTGRRTCMHKSMVSITQLLAQVFVVVVVFCLYWVVLHWNE